MGGSYSIESAQYEFGLALPQSYDPPRPEDLPKMEAIPAPSEVKIIEDDLKTSNIALKNSNKLLDDLKNHLEFNNLQEKITEKNNLIYRDFVKKISNQANEIVDFHEKYDKNVNKED